MDRNSVDIPMLLNLIEQESRPAFNIFYDVYYDQVFRYAYYFLKDTDACREVISDVFVSLWQSRKKLKQIECLETYLFVSVRNEVTRYNKRQNGTQFLTLDHVPVQMEIAGGDSSDNGIVFEEMEQLLSKIIGELPERCRAVFLLARQDGLKPKEIAERLSISENTVRVQMKIAIEKIIIQIKPYYPDLTFLALLSSLFGDYHT